MVPLPKGDDPLLLSEVARWGDEIHMRRFLAVMLILFGLGLLAYPAVRGHYYDHRQRQLLAQWAEWQEGATPALVEAEGLAGEETPAPDLGREEYIQDNMEGVLIIDKIGLQVPVLRKDTEENLNISVAHVEGTAGPGEVGNYCIAGHHMRAYGRHFNRLHEVTVGDEIEFRGPDATMIYQVTGVLIVQPEETWVLDPPEGEEALITLITCEYSRKPPLRLVVRGRLLI